MLSCLEPKFVSCKHKATGECVANMSFMSFRLCKSLKFQYMNGIYGAPPSFRCRRHRTALTCVHRILRHAGRTCETHGCFSVRPLHVGRGFGAR
ncbi:hypothetical protein V5799_029151 [Amblyomma americanum]|uniref:Uncharacterized protein n=1 Tax=Amblyomma americanum TaxID=6943 RepID=A0AAQ4ERU5_AMBAM